MSSAYPNAAEPAAKFGRVSLPFGEFLIPGGIPEGYNPAAPNPTRAFEDTAPNVSVNAADDDHLITTLPPQDGLTASDDSSLCFLTAYAKRVVVASKGFPRPLNNPKIPVFRIGESPGKGFGMFATRRIEVGEMICDERPLLVITGALGSLVKVPSGPHPDSLPEAQMRAICRLELEKILHSFVYNCQWMSESNRKALLELCNIHLHAPDGSGPILGVIRTNGFEVGVRDKGKTGTEPGGLGIYTGICKNLSRMNHSCSPNTYRNWSSSSFSMKVRAARVIEEGEEITTQYIEVEADFEERSKQLQKLYKMVCTCAACSDPVNSDKRRRELRSFFVAIKPEDVLNPLLKKLKYMEEEGLHAVDRYSSTLELILNFYMNIADEENALKYGKMFYAAECARGRGKRSVKYNSLEKMKADQLWDVKRYKDDGSPNPFTDMFAGLKWNIMPMPAM